MTGGLIPLSIEQRLQALEQESSDLASIVAQLGQRDSALGLQRQIWIAKTAEVSSYPTDPADTFGIIFLDGEYARTEGSPSVTYGERSSAPQEYAKSVAGNYYPEGSIVPVFEEDRQYWIADGGGSHHKRVTITAQTAAGATNVATINGGMGSVTVRNDMATTLWIGTQADAAFISQADGSETSPYWHVVASDAATMVYGYVSSQINSEGSGLLNLPGGLYPYGLDGNYPSVSVLIHVLRGYYLPSNQQAIAHWCEEEQKWYAIGCCSGEVTATLPTSAPTTQAPTTQAPTTQAPTTQPPTTTQAPTTQAPTTQAPTTQAPTTQAPTTQAPTTQAPTTQAPTTQAPTTQAPTTQAPTTQAPTTQAPTTQPPTTTQAPTTQAPTTQAPTTQPPTTTQAPTTQAPTTQAPTTQPPTTTQAPTTQAPTTQAPTTQAPTTQPPTTTQAPTTQAPTTQAPTTQPPTTTQAPTTQAPTTQAPTTQAPTTQPPTTTQAPTTQAPTTQAPTTQPPTTTQAPTTQAPTTQAPTTQAPTTQPPGNTCGGCSTGDAPDTLTVTLAGVTDGNNCDNCDHVDINTSHTVTISGTGDTCTWYKSVEGTTYPTPSYDITAVVHKGNDPVECTGGLDYFIEVTLHKHNDGGGCTQTSNVVWRSCYATAQDCYNLNHSLTYISGDGPNGCSGGSCTVSS